MARRYRPAWRSLFAPPSGAMSICIAMKRDPETGHGRHRQDRRRVRTLAPVRRLAAGQQVLSSVPARRRGNWRARRALCAMDARLQGRALRKSPPFRCAICDDRLLRIFAKNRSEAIRPAVAAGFSGLPHKIFSAVSSMRYVKFSEQAPIRALDALRFFAALPRVRARLANCVRRASQLLTISITANSRTTRRPHRRVTHSPPGGRARIRARVSSAHRRMNRGRRHRQGQVFQ